jgi:hypothetical protein
MHVDANVIVMSNIDKLYSILSSKILSLSLSVCIYISLNNNATLYLPALNHTSSSTIGNNNINNSLNNNTAMNNNNSSNNYSNNYNPSSAVGRGDSNSSYQQQQQVNTNNLMPISLGGNLSLSNVMQMMNQLPQQQQHQQQNQSNNNSNVNAMNAMMLNMLNMMNNNNKGGSGGMMGIGGTNNGNNGGNSFVNNNDGDDGNVNFSSSSNPNTSSDSNNNPTAIYQQFLQQFGSAVNAPASSMGGTSSSGTGYDNLKQQVSHPHPEHQSSSSLAAAGSLPPLQQQHHDQRSSSPQLHDQDKKPSAKPDASVAGETKDEKESSSTSSVTEIMKKNAKISVVPCRARGMSVKHNFQVCVEFKDCIIVRLDRSIATNLKIK